MAVKTEKTVGGDTVVDGAVLVDVTSKLLRELIPLAASIKKGLEQCPPGHMPMLGLNPPTLESFAEIFRAAAAVQLALTEACNAGTEDHGLAGMDCVGRG